MSLDWQKNNPRTFQDWMYEMPNSEYLDKLNALYDSDELMTDEEMFLNIKNDLAKGIDEPLGFYQKIKKYLEKIYYHDYYDGEEYV